MDTIKELEENKHRLELIKMARELLNEEYINRRAQDHNKWLAESDRIWKLHRVNLPYPPFASYPTDDEIVAKASALYNFVNAKTTPKPAETQPDLTPAEIAKALSISPITHTVEESPWKTYLEPDTKDETARSDSVEPDDTSNISEPEEQTPVPATLESAVLKEETVSQDQINPPVSAMQSLLPGWVRRSH